MVLRLTVGKKVVDRLPEPVRGPAIAVPADQLPSLREMLED